MEGRLSFRSTPAPALKGLQSRHPWHQHSFSSARAAGAWLVKAMAMANRRSLTNSRSGSDRNARPLLAEIEGAVPPVWPCLFF